MISTIVKFMELNQCSIYFLAMYYAEAVSVDDNGLKSYLTDLWNQSINMYNFHSSVSLDVENRAETYYTNFSETLEEATRFGGIADLRSTGALIFTISAIIASTVGLFKHKEIMYVYFPIFIVAMSHLIVSLLMRQIIISKKNIKIHPSH